MYNFTEGHGQTEDNSSLSKSGDRFLCADMGTSTIEKPKQKPAPPQKKKKRKPTKKQIQRDLS